MVNKLIDKRFSPRAFSQRMVEEEKLLTIFRAASYAASSRNEQPWNFIFATKDKPEEYGKLYDCLHEWNQRWAKLAPVLIVTVAKMHYEHKDYPNEHAWYDIGQAVATMAIQAIDMNIYMHQMGGFSAEKAKKLLHIPEGYEPVTMIAMGYHGNLNDLEEEYQKIENKERERKAFNEFVFRNSWKNK
jgi:nitroreductase